MSSVGDEHIEEGESSQNLTELPFPPITRDHILHCSYHYWHPRYRTITPKARLIPLSRPFVDYLKADGIIVPPEDPEELQHWDSDSGIFSADEGSDDGDEGEDPSANWPEVHQAILSTIAELGGKVVPKLNWSAPKDATWINATNSMDCTTPNDVYLLLKSSDFVTHDLEHAFDGCIDDDTEDEESVAAQKAPEIPYHLVLRKHILINPAVEFRCFVRRRELIAICQRDPNHYDFLFNMQNSLQMKIQDFFDQKIKDTFPDDNFTFDVYIPPPHDRVWLMDFNPWAPRTDPILFSWLELLTQSEPSSPVAEEPTEDFVRLSLSKNGTSETPTHAGTNGIFDLEVDEDIEGIVSQPEFRLIGKDDPEAYNFNSPQYSAHKLPRDVVDASQSGPGLREFAVQWKEMMAQRERERAEDSDD